MLPAPDVDHNESESLLRLPEVQRMTGLARSTIYKHVALHQFPAPVSLFGRAVAWRSAEVESWTRNRPIARTSPKYLNISDARATSNIAGSPRSRPATTEPGPI